MMKLASGGFLCVLLAFSCVSTGYSQSINSGTITGVVTDPSGAVVGAAQVRLHNPVTGYEQSATTDSSGAFRFNSIPQNNYRLTVTAPGFGAASQEVD